MFPQLFAQNFHLAERVLPLDNLIEQDLQPLRLDRLGQVVVGAFLDCFDGSLDRPLRCEDDDGERAAFVFQRAQQLEPAHVGHDEVADDDGRAEGGDALKRFFTVCRRVSCKSPGSHQLGESQARGGLILNNQDTLTGGGRNHLNLVKPAWPGGTAPRLHRY